MHRHKVETLPGNCVEGIGQSSTPTIEQNELVQAETVCKHGDVVLVSMPTLGSIS